MLGSDMTLGAISYLYTTTRAQKMYFLSCADFWMALSYSRYIEFCRQLKAGSEGIGTYFTCMEGWGVFAMAPVVSCGGSPNFILADPPKGALYHQRASWQALLAEGPLWEGSHWLGEGGPLERVCQGGAPCPIPREKSGTEVERPARGAVYSTP